MRTNLTRNEMLLGLACAVLLIAALAGPHIAQPAHIHDYADQRALWGIPCALDVLSNLPFALMGALGLFQLARLPREAVDGAQRFCAGLFFAGLLVTTLGSSWYHLRADDPGLALDRIAMSVAFAGLLGLVAATRISGRSGIALGSALLVLAPLSVLAWLFTGNVFAWAVVQFGGLLLVLLLPVTVSPLPGALDVRWILVVAAYALAKLFEVADHVVHAATGELFSGHTAKHVVAALAAWPVLSAVAQRAARQNGRHTSAAHVA
ncbi:MAG TPA: hypothetical protein VF522_05850 [Ramlibacter sp.]|uniref:hypothetical protein n=1 Tax=Ramlibacter sp. TaxID=1917967 RepID=UPI002ED037E3